MGRTDASNKGMQRASDGACRREKYALELVSFFGGLLLCRIRIGESSAPFGLALMAAAELAGIDPLFAAAGVLVGAFLSGEPLWGVMIAAAAFVLLLRVMKLFIRELTVSGRLLLFLLTEIAVLPFQMTLEWLSCAYAVLSIALSIGAVFLGVRSFSLIGGIRRLHTLTEQEQLTLTCLLGLFLLGMWDLNAAGVSLPVILLYVITLCSIYAKGPGGTAIGVLLAALLSFRLKQGSELLGTVSLCALLASLVAPYGRGYLAAAFAVSELACMAFLLTGETPVNLQNLLISTILFLAMPREWQYVLEKLLNSRRSRERNTAAAMQRLQERTAQEMEKTARLCSELSGIFEVEEDTQRYTEAWSIGAAKRVCMECEAKILCWRDAPGMEKAILTLLPAYDRGEPVRPLPPMDNHCKYFHEMMASAYQSYNQAFAHEAGIARTARQYAFMNRQLSGIASVLTGFSNRVRQDRWLDDALEADLFPYLERQGFSPYSIDAFYPSGKLLLRIAFQKGEKINPTGLLSALKKRIGKTMRLLDEQTEEGITVLEMEEAQNMQAFMVTATLPEKQQGVSGDATGEFRMPNGRVIYAVSDGMGSGEAANQESREAIELLFKLIKMGFDRELVYENVNRLLLNRARSETYATLDAASIDLFTGETELVKFGAPPTCLIRSGTPRMLFGEALPCGIVDEARPYIQKLHLRHRDTLVFFTDGVYDLLGREVESALRKVNGGGIEEMAQALLSAALQKGQCDDMTAMVVQVA